MPSTRVATALPLVLGVPVKRGSSSLSKGRSGGGSAVYQPVRGDLTAVAWSTWDETDSCRPHAGQGTAPSTLSRRSIKQPHSHKSRIIRTSWGAGPHSRKRLCLPIRIDHLAAVARDERLEYR